MHLANSYVAEELLHIHEEFSSFLLSDVQMTEDEYISLLELNIQRNGEIIYNCLLAPIIQKDFIVNCNTQDLLNRLEKKFLSDIKYKNNLIDYQKLFDILLVKRASIGDCILKSLLVAKYNQFYCTADLHSNTIHLNVINKAQAKFYIALILERLSKLLTCSIGMISKNIDQFVYHGDSFCSLIIEEQEYHFTGNIIIELNELLNEFESGYRFVPIIIQSCFNKQDGSVYKNWYRCSIELINFQQFQLYKEALIPNAVLLKTNLFQRILFNSFDHEILSFGTSDITLKKFEEIISESEYFSGVPDCIFEGDDYKESIEKACSLTKGILQFEEFSSTDSDGKYILEIIINAVRYSISVEKMSDYIDSVSLITGLNLVLKTVSYTVGKSFVELNGGPFDFGIAFVSEVQKNELIENGISM